ncbi:SoxR reducing system RseC family protein [Halomonas sp. Bachu 37]|uniref:SoxR reducing system RseC family protein n=1 Tax=Halomonas kashgarensis TaxID=3084920 RepID=UPI0032166970
MADTSDTSLCQSSYGCVVLETGVVLACDEHHALVEVSPRQGCSRCAQGRGCGLGLLARQEKRRISVALGSSPSPQIGDTVSVAIPARIVTWLALFTYGVPLLLALVSAGLVQALQLPAWAPPVAFFFALACAACGLRYFLSRKMERFRPRLVC